MNPERRASMAFPLVIAEGLDLEFFDSVTSAESKLEGIDVEDGLYVGYDAAGRKLRTTPRSCARFSASTCGSSKCPARGAQRLRT